MKIRIQLKTDGAMELLDYFCELELLFEVREEFTSKKLGIFEKHRIIFKG